MFWTPVTGQHAGDSAADLLAQDHAERQRDAGEGVEIALLPRHPLARLASKLLVAEKCLLQIENPILKNNSQLSTMLILHNLSKNRLTGLISALTYSLRLPLGLRAKQRSSLRF